MLLDLIISIRLEYRFDRRGDTIKHSIYIICNLYVVGFFDKDSNLTFVTAEWPPCGTDIKCPLFVDGI